MLILALDTSTTRATLVLGRPEGGPIAASTTSATRHASGLVPAIRDLLRSAALRPPELGLIAVGLGPGSFTGLRVGLAAAKGLAFAVGCPLVGLDSLEAIARGAPSSYERVRVAVDSRRDELFAADFGRVKNSDRLERLGPTRPVAVVDWLASLRPSDLPIGPALDREALRSRLPTGFAPIDPTCNSPSPSVLLDLARMALRAGPFHDPALLEPCYIRASAAEERADGSSERPVLKTPAVS